MGEDGQIARLAFFLGQDHVFAGQIREGQARDGGEGFGAVRGLLAGAQGFGAGHDFLVVFVGKGVVDALELGGFGGFALGGEAGVRGQDDRGAVLVVEEPALDGAFKDLFAGSEAGLEGGEGLLPGQRGDGVAVVQPRGEAADHGGEAAREPARIVFAQVEFHAVHGGFHGCGGDAVLRELGQRFHDQHFHVLGGAGRDGAQAHGEERLAQIRFKAAAGEVFAEAGFDQRLAQGRTGQAEEDVLQHFQHEEFARVGGFARQPVEGHMPLVAVFAGGIGEFKLAGHVEARLERHGAVGLAGREARQVRLKQRETLFFGVVAPEEEAGVGRVVVRLVERLEGLVGKLGDNFGVAAGVEAVGHVREQGLLRVLRQHGIRRGVHALHFVEDHAFVAERARRAVGFDVPAFLLEAVLVDAGEEHGVEVDVDEVVEILKVGAGDRVAGLVREGEGVEEGLERPLEQFDEGFFHRVFFRAAEDGVFKDMGYAGGVFRGGAERRAEALVLVVVDYGEQFRSGGVVPPQFDGAGNFGKPFLAHEAKAAGIHLGLLILHERLGERARRAGAHFPSGPPFSGGFTPERYSPFTWAAIAARRHYEKE